jgi:APA family basic amino acid/polyamine antiporter
MGDMAMKGVAIVVILLLSAINYIGVKYGSTLQTLFTLGKVVAILAMIALGFALGPRSPVHDAPGDSFAAAINFRDFALALVAGLFAFGGWHMVTYNAEETINPRLTIPRALMLGTLIVAGCYMALNAAYLHVLPLATVATSTRVAADAADAVLGFGGGAIMSGLVIFSTFGALSGIILAGPRVYFAMARDGLLFRWLGEIHPKFFTPHRAILVQALWSAILVGTGTYRALFTRVIYTEWIFFGVVAIGLFILRRRPNLARHYAVWGYPLVPAVFIFSAFAIVINQILSNVGESLLGLSFVLIGLPVYYLWAKHNAGESQPNQILSNG